MVISWWMTNHFSAPAGSMQNRPEMGGFAFVNDQGEVAKVNDRSSYDIGKFLFSFAKNPVCLHAAGR